MQDPKKNAIFFIVLLGFVSLFGDITYEGARSIIGPYLNELGASALMVGLAAGIGEFLGYSLRLVSGYLSDRTGAYWKFTIIGYVMILAVPLLSLTNTWQIASIFVILERIGKALRSPARDVLLSHATKQLGRGFGFGLHEAMDQIGAMLGPLVFTLLFVVEGISRDNYQKGLLWLAIPAVIVVLIVILARIKFPNPEKLETDAEKKYLHLSEEAHIPRMFWIYTVFIFLTVIGFANFQMISYHFKAKGLMTEAAIPFLYMVAMGVDGLAALIIGRIYDKVGLKSLVVIPFLTAAIPFLVYTNSFLLVVIGVVIWGITMGIHETVMRAVIADYIPLKRRGLTYGVFNTVYGLAWFLGSIAIGFFYDHFKGYFSIILFITIAQALALPCFIYLSHHLKKKPGADI